MIGDRERILAELEPLLQQAEREGKWLHCAYQDLWFSPRQLREEHSKGCFIWGPVNWTLRDPKEQIAEADAAARGAKDYASRVRARVEAEPTRCGSRC